jgi:hypothetical protein
MMHAKCSLALCAALKQAIKDPKVKKIEADIGSIDQFADSTNVVEDLALVKKLRAAYK